METRKPRVIIKKLKLTRETVRKLTGKNRPAANTCDTGSFTTEFAK